MRHILDRARARGSTRLKRFARQERKDPAPQTVRLRRSPKHLSDVLRLKRYLAMERAQ